MALLAFFLTPTPPVTGQETSVCVAGGAVPSGSIELAADCATLLAEKLTLRDSAKLIWWSGRSIEEWDGIGVQDCQVVGVSLPNRDLDGIIPTGLGGLSALRTLDLSSKQPDRDGPVRAGKPRFPGVAATLFQQSEWPYTGITERPDWADSMAACWQRPHRVPAAQPRAGGRQRRPKPRFASLPDEWGLGVPPPGSSSERSWRSGSRRFWVRTHRPRTTP